MSTAIAIQHIYCADWQRQHLRTPRDRYKQYFQDLYAIYPGEVTDETFAEGDQLTYAELGDHLFQHASLKKELPSIDLIIVAHWSQEFDPDYASCGPYFLHKYDLQTDIFDVCDNGTLATFIGLKVLNSYINAGNSQKVMLLCLEQTTVPRDKRSGDVIPAQSGAVAVILNKHINDAHYVIKATEIITEVNVLANLNKIDRYVIQQIADLILNSSTLLIVTRKSTAFWKVIDYLLLTDHCVFERDQFDFIEPMPGCLSALKKMDDIIHSDSEHSHVLIVDEDVESMTLGLLLLERQYD